MLSSLSSERFWPYCFRFSIWLLQPNRSPCWLIVYIKKKIIIIKLSLFPFCFLYLAPLHFQCLWTHRLLCCLGNLLLCSAMQRLLPQATRIQRSTGWIPKVRKWKLAEERSHWKPQDNIMANGPVLWQMMKKSPASQSLLQLWVSFCVLEHICLPIVYSHPEHTFTIISFFPLCI